MWSSLRPPESTTPNTEAAAGRGACGASSDARTSSAAAPTATRTMAITPTSPPPSETVAAGRDIPLEQQQQQQQQQCGHSSNKNRGLQRWGLRPEDDERFLQRLLAEDDDDQDDLETTNENPSTSSSYREHLILPQDTFHGICLFYKISPTDLRRANCFSGSSLLLAPRTLRIPIRLRDASSVNDGNHTSSCSSRQQQQPPQQDTSTTAYKVQALRHRFPAVQAPEAQAFLESNDGDLQAAVDFLLQHCTVE